MIFFIFFSYQDTDFRRYAQQAAGNLRMQGKMHRIRSLIPLQAAGNALAMHVQKRLLIRNSRTHERTEQPEAELLKINFSKILS
ncbi:MAG: hypothetical protein ACOYU4_10525 [Thermodesulfobacteriota bacterium]